MSLGFFSGLQVTIPRDYWEKWQKRKHFPLRLCENVLEWRGHRSSSIYFHSESSQSQGKLLWAAVFKNTLEEKVSPADSCYFYQSERWRLSVKDKHGNWNLGRRCNIWVSMRLIFKQRRKSMFERKCYWWFVSFPLLLQSISKCSNWTWELQKLQKSKYSLFCVCKQKTRYDRNTAAVLSLSFSLKCRQITSSLKKWRHTDLSVLLSDVIELKCLFH